jgi:PAS domain S-box-containing protein
MLSHTRSADPLPADAPASDVLRAPEHLRSARIIVADDDPGIVMVMRRLLDRAGYDSVIYTDRGAEVGMLCIEHDPDLVITDLRMPDRHGYEVVEDVRRLSGGAVPVLVVSGEERSVVMKKALACGARDFLSKPFEPAEALLRIRNLLDVRMLHKASLADAETRYRAMVEGASDLICQIDPAGQITYANRAGVALLGVELAGRRFHDLVHPDHRAAVRRFYCEQLKTGTPCTSHEFPLVVDGVEFWLEHKVQLDVVDGRVRGASSISRDVNARRGHEKLKDDLVSVVSHELRTPLTAIRGSLGLLDGGVLQAYPERAARMVKLALANSQRLGRLIDDMLDLEKLGSGKLEIQRDPCALAAILNETADTVRPLLEPRGVMLVVEAPELTVDVDAGRIRQVLTNLVSNAIKFSPQGGTIWLAAAAEDGALRLRVRDLGRGIPEGKLEAIFERFHQLDSSDSREKNGTGLGLSICRHLAALHGGRVWAESKPGAGSTFTVLLPDAVVAP